MNIDNQNKSYRNPHSTPIDRSWWRKLSYFTFYIMRESTAFFMIWVSIVLMYGVVCAHTNEVGQDEFYRFIFFLQHPVVVVINILALCAALLHTVTWFNLAPKATNIVIAAKKLPALMFVVGLWFITLAVSMYLLLTVYGYFR